MTTALLSQKYSILITGVITTQHGLFTIHNVDSGTYYLELSFMGYATKTIANILPTSMPQLKDIRVVNLTLGSQL